MGLLITIRCCFTLICCDASIRLSFGFRTNITLGLSCYYNPISFNFHVSSRLTTFSCLWVVGSDVDGMVGCAQVG